MLKVINIISSEFSRLIKSRIFKIALAVTAVLAAVYPVQDLYWHIKNVLMSREWGGGVFLFFFSLGFQYFFLNIIPLGFILAILISIFLGRETDDGTIANKIISGHSRKEIYLGFLITCFLCGIIIYGANIIFSVLFETITMLIACLFSKEHYFMTDEELNRIGGVDYFGEADVLVILPEFQKNIGITLKNTAAAFLIILVYCSLAVLIVMLMQSKSCSVLVCLVAAIALTAWGNIVYSAVMPLPDTGDDRFDIIEYDLIEIMKDEEARRGEALDGAKKQIMLFFDDFLPSNQSLALIDYYFSTRVYSFMIYDMIWIALTTGAGLLLFNKKDIKSGVKNE